MLCGIQDKNEMQFFLDQILTSAEINDLLDRLRIYEALTCTEASQRECAKTLNVSISKITRGASNLQAPKTKDYWKKKFNY
jgi:TrpR family trp operon transcriptional repressor